MLQFCPALMDWLLFLVSFVVLYGAGARGFTPAQWTWLGTIVQLAYLVSALFTGHWLKPGSTRALLLVSTLLAICTFVAALWFQGYVALLILSAIIGVLAAIFFTAFQTFMRLVSPPGQLPRVVGFYTLSWSCGAGLGFLSAGGLYRWGPWALSALVLLVGGAMLVILWRTHPAPADHPRPAEIPAVGLTPVEPVVGECYVRIGWLLIFVAVFALRPVQNYLPPLGAQAGRSPLLTTLPLFLQITAQGLAGWIIQWRPQWLYQRQPILRLQWLAAAIFLILAFAPPWTALLGLPLIGVWSGCAYYWAVYYSSSAGRRAWNLGVNEFLVGGGALVGLFVVGFLLAHAARPETTLYLSAAVSLLVTSLGVMSLVPRAKTNNENV